MFQKIHEYLLVLMISPYWLKEIEIPHWGHLQMLTIQNSNNTLMMQYQLHIH